VKEFHSVLSRVSLRAGMARSLAIAGSDPLRAKTQHVLTGFAALIHGWHRADALARIFTGDPLDPNYESTLPTQLITQDDVDEAPLRRRGLLRRGGGLPRPVPGALEADRPGPVRRCAAAVESVRSAKRVAVR
jgi:hypothetical protein